MDSPHPLYKILVNSSPKSSISVQSGKIKVFKTIFVGFFVAEVDGLVVGTVAYSKVIHF